MRFVLFVPALAFMTFGCGDDNKSKKKSADEGAYNITPEGCANLGNDFKWVNGQCVEQSQTGHKI